MFLQVIKERATLSGAFPLSVNRVPPSVLKSCKCPASVLKSCKYYSINYFFLRDLFLQVYLNPASVLKVYLNPASVSRVPPSPASVARFRTLQNLSLFLVPGKLKDIVNGNFDRT